MIQWHFPSPNIHNFFHSCRHECSEYRFFVPSPSSCKLHHGTMSGDLLKYHCWSKWEPCPSFHHCSVFCSGFHVSETNKKAVILMGNILRNFLTKYPSWIKYVLYRYLYTIFIISIILWAYCHCREKSLVLGCYFSLNIGWFIHVLHETLPYLDK